MTDANNIEFTFAQERKAERLWQEMLEEKAFDALKAVDNPQETIEEAVDELVPVENLLIRVWFYANKCTLRITDGSAMTTLFSLSEEKDKDEVWEILFSKVRHQCTGTKLTVRFLFLLMGHKSKEQDFRFNPVEVNDSDLSPGEYVTQKLIEAFEEFSAYALDPIPNPKIDFKYSCNKDEHDWGGVDFSKTLPMINKMIQQINDYDTSFQSAFGASFNDLENLIKDYDNKKYLKSFEKLDYKDEDEFYRIKSKYY